jgi:voltage-gated potassium channel
VSNPLLIFWQQLFGLKEDRERGKQVRRMRSHPSAGSATQASATIFLIMRRMRAPLIILILIFAVSVLGLTIVPGQDAHGDPTRMSFFDAFYFMSYTATTIGFGELPNTFTDAQRLWVTVCIYLTVVGWAYAIGSMLSLLQDRAFRQAVSLQRFSRKVRRLREPFLLIAGYGRTGQLLGQALDALGQQFVVIDVSDERIDSLDLDPYHADVPGLVGDVRNPSHLGIAGLDHPFCSGVLALTNDDEANLAVTMSVALLRPELQVIARTVSPAVATRMEAFGTPKVVNPFDRFGDHLRLALRAPASYQLLSWLEAGPGAELPERGHPPTDGRWVLCGYGRFGRELYADLRAEGLDVTVIEPQTPERRDQRAARAEAAVGVAEVRGAEVRGAEAGVAEVEAAAAGALERDAHVMIGDASSPMVMVRADLANAVGFVAGTDNDTTNLSLVAAARRVNPQLYVAARQNVATNAPLFEAMDVDSLLVPAEVVAHEVYAQLSTPLLWRFLQDLPGQGDEWAAEMLRRLRTHCGRRLDALWKVQLTSTEAPALVGWLAGGGAKLGDLLQSPEDRGHRLHLVPLLVRQGSEHVLAPADDFGLRLDDEILFAGLPAERRLLETTLLDDAAREYVLFDRHIPASWIWRKLSRRPADSASPTGAAA